MRPPLSSITAFTLLGTLALAGCGRTTWVDADPTSCDAQLVAHVNTRHDAQTQGAAICARKGKPQFTGRFRCKNNALQAQCRT